MKRDEIMANIASLARSQGFYGRLYCKLIRMRDNQPDSYDKYMTNLESQNFRDVLDIVACYEVLT